jgi:hypothetical protein
MIFKPTYEGHRDGDAWVVTVTPPEMFGLPGRKIRLTDDQHQRFLRWRRNEGLVQDLLPELSASERECLMTGLSDEKFEEFAR